MFDFLKKKNLKTELFNNIIINYLYNNKCKGMSCWIRLLLFNYCIIASLVTSFQIYLEHLFLGLYLFS